MTQADCRRFLIEALLAEDEQLQEISIPAQSDEQRRLLRALMNVRPPAPIADDVLQVQDEYLLRELAGAVFPAGEGETGVTVVELK